MSSGPDIPPFPLPDPADLLFNRYTWLAIGVLTVLYSIKNYMKGAFYSSGVRLGNKTIVITGGNGGIGKEMALDFARRGAKIILACRDEDDTKTVIERVEEVTGSKSVKFMHLDLNSFESVREFASKLLKEEEKIDILVNNAGVMMHPEQRTADGWDVHLQTNFLGPMLLTELLLERLIASAPARIVNTSASAYQLAELHLNDLNLDTDFTPGKAFSQSKLALMMWSVDLSQRLWDKGVTVNSFHPGVTRTGIHRHMAFRTSMLVQITFAPFMWLLMKNPQDGAQTALYLCVAPEVAHTTGKYYVDCAEKQLDDKLLDEKVVDALLEKARDIVGLKEVTAATKTPPPPLPEKPADKADEGSSGHAKQE